MQSAQVGGRSRPRYCDNIVTHAFYIIKAWCNHTAASGGDQKRARVPKTAPTTPVLSARGRAKRGSVKQSVATYAESCRYRNHLQLSVIILKQSW